LSPQRPHPNIFSPYVILSLLGQFAIHLTFLITAVKGAQAFMPEECIEPDSEFSPNLVNTVSYMANMMIQVCAPKVAAEYRQCHPTEMSFLGNIAYPQDHMLLRNCKFVRL